jgi:type II secretory pathway pseudopilin PulG
MTRIDPNRPSRRLHTATRILRAFTLIEMLIAVGAVALIAVGLSKLFASTGQTIKAGRKISTLSEAAATLERQIRNDIASMATSGDGFLVIRNKMIAKDGMPGAGIKLSTDDRNPAPRTRRVDEFLFFANGSFTSAREPQVAGRIPVGAAARIYYGHGMRLDPDGYRNVTIDADPIWNNPNNPATGQPVWATPSTHIGGLGEQGPNEFAGSWTLLRNVTVLARPQKTTASIAAGSSIPEPFASQPAMWPDSYVQIALQPAAASIFRMDPLRPNNPDLLGYGYKTLVTLNPVSSRGFVLPGSAATAVTAKPARPNDVFRWPAFASGMVDIAAIDLNIIRARVVGVGPDPDSTTPAGNLIPDDTYFGVVTPVRGQMTGITYPILTELRDPNYRDKNTVHAQKMTMASAMPGNDPWLFRRNGIATPTTGQAGNTPQSYSEQRMLYAPEPPDFTGNLTTGARYPDTEPYHRQDQSMLSASVITPGCTEFIVEWSFGDVYAFDPATPNASGIGGIVWHGLEPLNSANNPYRVKPYRARRANQSNAANPADEFYNGVNRPVPAGLIHWPVQVDATSAHPTVNEPQMPLYSFFGYQDPTYDAPDGARNLDWPWPTLLRITYTLTDPSDPTNEQTYQFVVQVPAQQRKPS